MPYLIMGLAQGTGSGPNHANVQLLGDSVSAEDVVVGVNARFRFNTDGSMDERASGGYVAIDPYWIPAPEASIGDYYEVRYTTNSGSDADEFGMIAGTWYALTSSREMGLSSAVGTNSGNFTVEIRDAATQTLRASGTYTISATVLP